jgi:hypothetical protein
MRDVMTETRDLRIFVLRVGTSPLKLSYIVSVPDGDTFNFGIHEIGGILITLGTEEYELSKEVQITSWFLSS